MYTHPVAVDDLEPIFRIFAEIRDLTGGHEFLPARGALFLKCLDCLDPLRALQYKKGQKGTMNLSGGARSASSLVGRKMH